MKLSQIPQADVSVIVRNACATKMTKNLSSISGCWQFVHNFPIGTRIEFPSSTDDLKVLVTKHVDHVWNARKQSRLSNGRFGPLGCYEPQSFFQHLLLVLVNKKPQWISFRSLCLPFRQPVSQKYSFQQELMKYSDDEERALYLIGKTVEVAGKKQYWTPVFKNGLRTDKHVRKTYSILREVHE